MLTEDDSDQSSMVDTLGSIRKERSCSSTSALSLHEEQIHRESMELFRFNIISARPDKLHPPSPYRNLPLPAPMSMAVSRSLSQSPAPSFSFDARSLHSDNAESELFPILAQNPKAERWWNDRRKPWSIVAGFKRRRRRRNDSCSGMRTTKRALRSIFQHPLFPTSPVAIVRTALL